MEKYRYFIDESGDASLKNINKDFPVFVLCGVLISESEYIKLSEKINSLKQNIFESTGIILHSTDIRKCDKGFAKLFDLNLKEKFYTELNSIMTKINFKVISVIINKEEHIKTYGKLAEEPYELALTFMLERAIFATDNKTNEEINIIIESRGAKEDEQLAKRYSQIYDRGTYFVSDVVRIQKRLPSRAVFKKKSENDIGLQIADLCAYPIARNNLYPNEPYPAYDIVEKKFYKNSSGKIDGYGRKYFPYKTKSPE